MSEKTSTVSEIEPRNLAELFASWGPVHFLNPNEPRAFTKLASRYSDLLQLIHRLEAQLSAPSAIAAPKAEEGAEALLRKLINVIDTPLEAKWGRYSDCYAECKAFLSAAPQPNAAPQESESTTKQRPGDTPAAPAGDASQFDKSSDSQREQDFCWLVEKWANPAWYWTGKIVDGEYWGWSVNAHEAVRFYTKEAAESVKLQLRLYQDWIAAETRGHHNGCEAVEHGFIYAAPSTEQALSDDDDAFARAHYVAEAKAAGAEPSPNYPRMTTPLSGETPRGEIAELLRDLDDRPDKSIAGVESIYFRAAKAIRQLEGELAECEQVCTDLLRVNKELRADLAKAIANHSADLSAAPSATEAFEKEIHRRLEKLLRDKVEKLADVPENGYVEGNTNAFIWTNKEAEWTAIVLEEMADEELSLYVRSGR